MKDCEINHHGVLMDPEIVVAAEGKVKGDQYEYTVMVGRYQGSWYSGHKRMESLDSRMRFTGASLSWPEDSRGSRDEAVIFRATEIKDSLISEIERHEEKLRYELRALELKRAILEDVNSRFFKESEQTSLFGD